jgi:hypothetical protein
MHRALAAWLTARPWRAAFASALCGALSAISPLPYASPLPFVVLSGAISVLVLLRFDTTSAFGVAFSGAMAASLIVLTQMHASVWLFAAVLWIFFAPVALAALLKRTQSMNLCVQTAVLATAGCVLLIYAVLEDPAEFWIPLVTRAVDAASESLFYPPDERELIVNVWAQTMWGALAAYSLALVLGALFLGRWWESLLRAPGEFGLEYRRLRLGIVLGTCITVLFALLVLNRTSLIASLAWVGLPALVFQGLAAAHRSKARGSLNRGWLAAIYVLLIVPLWNSVTICVLALWGFVDNWRRPKVQGA